MQLLVSTRFVFIVDILLDSLDPCIGDIVVENNQNKFIWMFTNIIKCKKRISKKT